MAILVSTHRTSSEFDPRIGAMKADLVSLTQNSAGRSVSWSPEIRAGVAALYSARWLIEGELDEQTSAPDGIQGESGLGRCEGREDPG